MDHFSRGRPLGEEEERRAGIAGEQSAFASALLAQIEEKVRALDDVAILQALLRTLAPDWPAYKRKAAIAIKAAMADYAAPWLVRDVNFLSGQILAPAETL